MEKASKWLMNFLLGKKEERTKKKDVAFLEENVVANSAAIVPLSPKIRRRWSFGRSSSKEKTHKCCKSLDSITINPVVVGAIAVLDKQQQQQQSKALFSVAAVKTSAVERVVAPPKLEIDEASRRGVICRVVQDLAATKIQAVFRSYLARKALCALRALVKLQALVRGYLVRKQTTATLRQMHALMTIQVRARFHRIQMVEEQTQLVVKSQSSRNENIPHDNGNGSFRRSLREAIDFNAYKAAQGVPKCKNGYSNHSQMKKLEHGVAAYFSGDVSFSKREHHHQYDEFSFSTAAHNTPQPYYYHPETPEIIPGRASISGRKPDYLLPLPHHDHSFLPNYMANTESSKAKVRSQSEPKQRPGSNTKVTSMDRTGVVPPVVTQTQRHSSPRSADRNQDPWFVKLYRSKRWVKESESDANSKLTSHSSYYGNSAMAYEVS
ncbi:hypothetical protein Ddye_025578 [Dipteronia dyeriana]|uniref:DUF4005 domain-containing protein n=1 Tax=Dipteronia dyeriana TaxID=168575 RepID=A0AAD9TL26_9ROSI|nr:hypothetical protein Ddye_025578 [Dipteronia dyeriana]